MLVTGPGATGPGRAKPKVGDVGNAGAIVALRPAG